MKKKANAFGIAGFIISLCSVITLAIPVGGIIIPLIGAVFCFVGLMRSAKKNLGIGLAVAGLSIGLVLSLFGGAITVSRDSPSPQQSGAQQPVQTVSETQTANPINPLTPTPEAEQSPTTDPAAVEAEYRKSCRVINYKDLCRYPDDYYGTNVVIEVKIYQIMDVGGWLNDKTAWRAMSDTSEYGLYLDDEYYLVDDRDEGSLKVLSEDVVKAYGTFEGLQSATRSLTGEEVEIPRIDVKYLDLISE